MAAQGIVRAIRDIDVFVAPDADNVARLRAALHEVFDDPAIDSITAEDLAGEYPAIQYVPRPLIPESTSSPDWARRFASATSKRT
jgi:hypothetical protein